ncbi:MAG: hypothetical protein ACXVPU_11125 [Bacteroidia bacterium]
MRKYFYFILLLFITSTAAVGQEILATQKIPASAMPGTDFVVETTVNRGSVTGFMKFFQELPEGYTATDIESKGGSFTYADNGAKIVWLAPPSETVYILSYKVTVPANAATGQKSLPCKISYISNNERKVLDLEPKTIMIGNGSVPVVKKDVPPATTSTPATVATTPVVAKTTPPPANPTPPVTTAPVVKKETSPATTTPSSPAATPTFSKVPTSALPASQGKIYKVQIGAFAAKPKIEGVPELSTFVLDNGITKYFSGKFSLYEDAVKRKKEMIDKGFQGAFIVAFENGQIVK